MVLVGDRKDSEVYVRMKLRACERVGITSRMETLTSLATQEEVETIVSSLVADDSVDGVLVQMPLPDSIDAKAVLAHVPPEKDVDGCNPANIGHLALKGHKPVHLACTPQGCLELIRRAVPRGELRGLNAVVLGRSDIVGVPMALMLLRESCTVTICHSGTRDLEEECRRADILVVAVGRPKMVKGSWLKEGAVVIDVGINYTPDSTRKSGVRMVGDVDYDDAISVASALTPVPGGVGPLTVAMLMHNTVKAYRAWIEQEKRPTTVVTI